MLYIPVIAICRMLGIRADTHMRRWRRMLLWEDARKLPFSTPRGTRIVWCLGLGSVPFLYGYCNWKEVSPLRRAQLRQATQATEEAVEVVARAYQDMQLTYRRTRQALYRFLVAFAPLESTLQRKVELLRPYLDQAGRLQFEALVELGCTLSASARRLASTIVQWQAAQPVMEVFTIDADGSAQEADSLPLLPVLPQEEIEAFFVTVEQRRLLDWRVRSLCKHSWALAMRCPGEDRLAR
jgi:hypothetical protein